MMMERLKALGIIGEKKIKRGFDPGFPNYKKKLIS